MTSFLRKKSKQAWLAVVLGEGRTDFVGVNRDPGCRPKVFLAESIERRGDDAKTLNVLRRPLGLSRYRCTTVLDPNEYQLIRVSAPPVPAAEAREMLRWKLKNQIEFPVDNASIDLLPIPGSVGAAQVFAVVAANSAVSSRVQTFQAAKVPLEAIDLPEISQRNLSALFEEPGKGLAMLIFDDNTGLLTLTKDGELIFVNRIGFSARHLLKAEQDQRALMYEQIGLDIQRSLDSFDRADDAVVLSRLIVAPIPGLDGFMDYLSKNMSLPVVSLDLAAALDFGSMPGMIDPQRQFQSLRALGAALRVEAALA